MSNAIKIVQSETDQALAKLHASIQALEVPLNASIQDENELSLVEVLNQTNESLAAIIRTYQSLLLEHEAATKKAIESIIQSDQNIAAGIRLHK